MVAAWSAVKGALKEINYNKNSLISIFRPNFGRFPQVWSTGICCSPEQRLVIKPNIYILFYSGSQSHAPSNDFFPFRKLRFGGRQSNVSMTITACGVSRTTISMSIVRVFELLFHLY